MGGRARRGKKTEDRGQTVQNTEYPPASPEGEADGGQVEQQNKEPQNDEVITSTFEIPCSIFCGSERRQLR
jgi:hypothetical protein